MGWTDASGGPPLHLGLVTPLARVVAATAGARGGDSDGGGNGGGDGGGGGSGGGGGGGGDDDDASDGDGDGDGPVKNDAVQKEHVSRGAAWKITWQKTAGGVNEMQSLW